ncbi:MAG: hypothetical protein R3322_14010 [Kiloniellales bacterium]|nr:hypothetical protein [Kiloniellales bacterium]
MHDPFRYVASSPNVIRLAVTLSIRYPPSLRQVEDLPFERVIAICRETVRFWWARFAARLAAKTGRRRPGDSRAVPQRRWRLDEDFVNINGEYMVSGGPWIAKARRWRSSPRSAGAARRLWLSFDARRSAMAGAKPSRPTDRAAVAPR